MIADAVLRILADEGSKGLSHRRVDREAGLPIGTTVHHAPTRGDLFIIAAERLNELMIQDLQKFTASLQEEVELTPEVIAKNVIRYWRKMITPESFYRLRAEMAVLYSQEFRHEVHLRFRPQLEQLKTFWTKIFTDLGAPAPDQASLEFTTWNRGLFGIMAACDGEMDEGEHTMFETWIVKMIRSFLVAPQPH